MFLEMTEKRNPLLIEAAIQLHQEGLIQPDTYVLDLDSIIENAKKIADEASKYDIELFFMTKQIGRNPLVAKEISKLAYKGAVVVDYREALVMMESGIELGNVGHLVQVPCHLLKSIMEYGASYLTLYSIEKLKQIDTLAKDLGIVQNILIKVQEKDDLVYDGQHGGFSLKEIPSLIETAQSLSHVHISGITSFPCFLFDEHEIAPTSNLETLNLAKQIFEKSGMPLEIVNMPSASCVSTIKKINEFGGNQGEPGHALTGTIPIHAVKEQAEIPAMLYVSEISHNYEGKSYLFGGGYYRRSHWENILVVDRNKKEYDTVLPFTSESIDYYIGTGHTHSIGATVLSSFRTQIFVTRSEVAVVSGIQAGKHKLLGIYDSQGKYVRGGADGKVHS